MLDLIIKNGWVVNATHSQQTDIAVKDGKIVAMGQASLFPEAEKTVDADGLWILPGMIDTHVHMYKRFGASPSQDNYYDGTIAAAYGGTTSIVDFGFPYGDETPAQAMQRKLDEIKGQSVIDYSFHSNLTKANEENYGQIRELIQQGFPSVKMFTIFNYGRMLEKAGIYEVLRIIAKENGLAMIHTESADLIDRYIADTVAKGHTLPIDLAKTRPPITELEALYALISMVEDTGAPTIVAHMTASGAAPAIAQAKHAMPLFIECCTHYLTLDESVYQRPDACRYTCVPPMRDLANQAKLWDMVNQGLIDVISSDHTDFSSEQKDSHKDDFTKIPNGLPGIETRGIVLFSEGVSKGRITPNRFVEITSAKAAKLMGVYPNKGVIQVGSDADFAILDPKAKYTIHAKDHHMQTDYAPFEGMEMTGKVVHTVSRGAFVIENSVYTNTQHRGQLLKRTGPILS